MFTREKTISLPLSTSFLPNNLSVFAESESRIHYAITHLNSVILSSVENQIIHHKELPCQISGTANACNFIIQAKWVTVGKRTILIVCSQRGIQIYEWDGSLFLHWHAFKNQENDDLEETYALGVGVLGNELLCIGTYSGSILVFSVPQEGEITFSEKVTGTHLMPITDICNDNNILASSDSSGFICLWANNGFLEKKTTIASYDSPCTSLAIFQGSLIAAYGSGHLRIFDIDTGTIKAEVTAHAKWITAIDVAPKTGMLLSVSEDTFLRIWQLGQNEEPVISHKFSECVTDSLLCGGKFENENGDHLCLSSYDSPDLIRYHLLS